MSTLSFSLTLIAVEASIEGASLTAVTATEATEILLSLAPSFALNLKESEVVSPPLCVYVNVDPAKVVPAETAAPLLLGSVKAPYEGTDVTI